MSDVAGAIAFARANHERYLSELNEVLRIPGISTLAEHKPDLLRTADWLAAQMKQVGLNNVAIYPTPGNPVVYGEWLGAPGKPTLLIYGHYDVQPVDPLNEWQSPPFEASVRGDELYARGAADMKSQIHSALKAIEAYLQGGKLPLNIKVFVEGEEELGSPNLPAFMSDNHELLACDLFLNCDAGIERADLPSLVYGLRGNSLFELWVYGPSQDLHSGLFGGSVHNPAIVLCELIAGMHDANGHITLPGFYDKVRVLSAEERAEIARAPHSDEAWQQKSGAPALYGEVGFSTLERLFIRPTLEICGMSSGFTGEGMKTIVPAKAMAKISTRLVPYQDADAVEEQLKDYVSAHAPASVRWEIKRMTRNTPAVLAERDTHGMRAAAAALKEGFGQEPLFQLFGASVPVVTMAREILGVDVVTLGFAILSESNAHSPNEHTHLPSYFKGTEVYIRFFEKFGG